MRISRSTSDGTARRAPARLATRRAAGWLLAPLAIIVGLVVSVSPANAAPPYPPAVGSIIQIWSIKSGRCLDADLNTIGRNGTRVQLWDCNGQNQQKWRVLSWGSDPAYISLQNLASGRCLDADLNTINQNGTVIQLWDCNGAGQQVWASNNEELRPFGETRCLDADLNSINVNGGRVQLWDCNGLVQQQWYYVS